MIQQTFVFVVCGGEEHISTVNFSLVALRKQTDLSIIVVTDLKRNELAIDHPSSSVIDVDVPEKYDHHQASIFLKTGLHKFLPMNDGLYCYLDTATVSICFAIVIINVAACIGIGSGRCSFLVFGIDIKPC